jgi:predicted HicB family RNase H-like nuclease
MNILSYKGHKAIIEFDAEDGIFVGHLAGINDIIGFHAETVAGLTAAFHETVDDYIDTCKHLKKSPEKSFSGKVMFRVAPDVHAKAALAAQLAGKSLNQWAEETLRQAAEV